MNVALEAFRVGLHELRSYIRSLQLTWDLLGLPAPAEHIEVASAIDGLKKELGTGATKRRLDYNSVIVTLYGHLEQFIEGLAREYTKRLNSVVPSYGLLPEAMRKHHIDLTYELLRNSDHPRLQEIASPEHLIANLHSCLNVGRPYQLNCDAFSLHTANFRISVVDQLLARMGIIGIKGRLRKYPPFNDYLKTVFDRELEAIAEGEEFVTLDDLAQRRNDVAHGSIQEILSIPILSDYVDYVEMFGEALYALSEGSALEHEIEHSYKEVGAPIAVYNNAIVCLKLSHMRIQHGDLLVAKTGDSIRPLRWGPVVEIQVDGNNRDALEITDSMDVALRVEFHAKPNYSYYLRSPI